jgi:hypothetical protein
MESTCGGCGLNVSACRGLWEGCRFRMVLAAVHRLLVVGEDPCRSLSARQRHRMLARRRLRRILTADERARETWPAWAREVDQAVTAAGVRP